MKRSSRKVKKIIKSHEADEKVIGGFCLISIEDELPEEKESVEEEVEETVEEKSEPLFDEEEIRRRVEEELAKVKDKAYSEGYRRGYSEGLSKGKKEGFDKGYGEGYEQGKEEGKKEGFQAGYQEGYEKGTRKGFEEGKRAGREAIQKRYDAIVGRAEENISSLSELVRQFEQRLSEIEDLLVDIVVTAMQKLFFYVPEEEMIRNTVKEMLSRIEEGLKAKIYLNPKDKDLVEGSLDLPAVVELVADSSLKRGSCVAEMETGSLETSLKERLKDFEEIVLKRINGN